MLQFVVVAAVVVALAVVDVAVLAVDETHFAVAEERNFQHYRFDHFDFELKEEEVGQNFSHLLVVVNLEEEIFLELVLLRSSVLDLEKTEQEILD